MEYKNKFNMVERIEEGYIIFSDCWIYGMGYLENEKGDEYKIIEQNFIIDNERTSKEQKRSAVKVQCQEDIKVGELFSYHPNLL